MNTECKCGKPTKDAAYVCDGCSDQLARALGDTPWLAEELEITITRQKGLDYRSVGGGSGAKKDAERPSPVQWGAADARADLKGLLVSWTKFCHDKDIRHQSRHFGLPDDNLPALSRYLLDRVDGLALDEAGGDAVDEITASVGRCHRIIDRPADRQYLGDCQEAECDGRMYAQPGAEFARCEGCGTPVKADDIRAKMLDELDDRLCTASEIAHLATYLGLQSSREQVRKRIEYWGRKQLIERESAFSDQAAYRFGLVWRLLVLEDARAKKPAA